MNCEIPAPFDNLLKKIHILSLSVESNNPLYPLNMNIRKIWYLWTKKNRQIGGCTYGAIIG